MNGVEHKNSFTDEVALDLRSEAMTGRMLVQGSEPAPELDKKIVISLALLLVAREVASELGCGRIGQALAADLDRMIAELVCHIPWEESQTAQQSRNAITGIEVAAAFDLAARYLAPGTLEEKLCRARQLIHSDALPATTAKNESNRTASGGALKSGSPLAAVISYSSSINEFYFW